MSPLFALVVLACRAPPGEAPPAPRRAEADEAALVTAIGDVHGDLKTFRALLLSLGLMDREGRWTGGETHLVQTGDLLDRGPGSRQVLDLLMRLEKEAPAAGGRVVVLLGNHEVMNVCADLRYTTREEYAAFAADEAADLSARRKEEILTLVRKGSPLLRSNYYRSLSRYLTVERMDLFFPRGYFAHRDAFSPTGKYGRWILELPVIHRESRAVFLHGGLSPRFGTIPLDEINRRVKEDLLKYLDTVSELEEMGVFDSALGFTELLMLLEAEKRAGKIHPKLAGPLKTLDSLMEGILFSEDGPLWYRGLALESEDRLRGLVRDILKTHDVDRIVIGHTQPLDLAVEARCGKRVFLIDTGMNQAVYHGRPSALVLFPDGKYKIRG
jgi:hypothetical protein